MKRTFAYLTFLFVSIGVVAWARMGGLGQGGMQLPFVLRQASTPGTQETGNTNISGTMIAGQFKGVGAALTNVNADLIDGLDSTAFGKVGSGNTWTSNNAFTSGSNSFTGTGAGLTNLHATNIVTGTLADARLTSNVALLNLAQSFSAAKTFSAAPSFTAGGTPFTVSDTGLVTNLNADFLDGLSSSAFGQITAGNNWQKLNIFSSSITIPPGAGAGKVLTSDAGGFASWATGAPPSGNAGGDLTGTYPNPTLAPLPSSLAKVSGGLMSSDGSDVMVGDGGAHSGIFSVFTNIWATAGYFVNTAVAGYGVFATGTYAGIRGEGSYYGGILIGNGDGAGVYGSAKGIGTGGQFVSNSGIGVLGSGPDYGGYFDGRGYFSDKVGIGTTAPTEKLEIRGGGGPTSITFQPGKHYASDQANKATIDIPGTGDLLLWDNVHVNNVFTAGTKNFLIDHPSDPYNKFLRHGTIESNEYKNLYDGTVTTDDKGYARVSVPSWFTDLNESFRYQVTVVDEGDSADFVMAKIAKKLNNGAFMIRTSKPNVEVCWQITGVRKDAFAKANPLIVEEVKPDYLRGKLIHPEAFGEKDWSPQPLKSEPKRPRLPSPPSRTRR